MTSSILGIAAILALLVWVQVWARYETPRPPRRPPEPRPEPAPAPVAPAVRKARPPRDLAAWLADPALDLDEETLCGFVASERYLYQPLDSYVAEFRDDFRALASARKASLPVRPFCDLRTLFEEHPPDPSLDALLFGAHSPAVLAKYCAAAGRSGQVFYIPSSKKGRRGIERLCEAGLARSGRKLQPAEVTSELTLADLNGILARSGRSPVRTKLLAIEEISRFPDARSQLARVLDLDDYFVLDPLPAELASVPLERIQARCRYYAALARLMTMDRLAERTYRDALERSRSVAGIAGWSLLAAADKYCCPYCNEAAKRRYPPGDPPRIPFHTGCRCSVRAEL